MNWSMAVRHPENYFAAAADLAKHRWEDIGLLNVLQGRENIEFEEHEATTQFRIKHLEAENRIEECYNLSKHAGWNFH